MTFDLSDRVRDRLPDFKTEFERAIALTEASQPRFLVIWVDFLSKEQIKRIIKNIDQVAWGKKDKQQKLALYQQTIKMYAELLQRVVIHNCQPEGINLKPLQNLYSELVELLPQNEQIQLQIDLTIWQ